MNVEIAREEGGIPQYKASISHVAPSTTTIFNPLMGSIVNRACGDIQVPYTSRSIILVHTEVDIN